MKAHFFSDTHGLHKIWENKFPIPFDPTSPEADAIIFTGDLSGRGYDWEIQAFFDWFSMLPHTYKIMIAGNHDFGFQDNEANMLAMMPDNIIYLNDTGIELEGIKFWGSPIQPAFGHWAFNRERGDDIKKHWDMIPDDTQILLTHGPPFGILDYVPRNDEQVGCRDLFMTITLRLKELKVHAFGHIHEGAGLEERNGVTYINGSVVDLSYQVKYPGYILDI